MALRIRELREDHDLKQTDLAKALCVSQATYSRYESGKMTIPHQLLCALADYYHTSVDYLLGRTDSKEPPEASGGPLRSALLGNFDQLNLEGQERLVETSDDMVSSGKYIKSDKNQLGKAQGA